MKKLNLFTLEECSSGGKIVVRAKAQRTQIVPEADAHLIAAAPDLLEACKWANEAMEGSGAELPD